MGGKTRYKYCVPDHCDESRYSFESQWQNDPNYLEYIAEDAAENYHDSHDGWESVWSLTFEIFLEGGKSLGEFVVDLEARPHFSATAKD